MRQAGRFVRLMKLRQINRQDRRTRVQHAEIRDVNLSDAREMFDDDEEKNELRDRREAFVRCDLSLVVVEERLEVEDKIPPVFLSAIVVRLSNSSEEEIESLRNDL